VVTVGRSGASTARQFQVLSTGSNLIAEEYPRI
jgi:hypothetical protein